MAEALNLEELTSRREKLKVISMLGQDIIRDTVQVNKDAAKEMIEKGVSLFKSVREGISSKWTKLKEGLGKAKESVLSFKDRKVKAVKEAPAKVGKAFVSAAKTVADVSIQGAGLLVGSAVLGAQKGVKLAGQAKDGVVKGVKEVKSSVRQGYRDTKASVIHAQRKARDVKNVTVQGAKDFVGSAKTLMSSAKEGISGRWGSLKENLNKKVASLAISAILAKDNLVDGVTNVGKAVKEAPAKVGKAFVSSARTVADVSVQGAGLLVGSAVLGARKGAELAGQAKDGFVNGVKEVKKDVTDAFVNGAKIVAVGGKNLKGQVVEGYANLVEGVSNTLSTMGNDIKNSNLVKEVKKVIENDKKQFNIGYQMALNQNRR